MPKPGGTSAQATRTPSARLSITIPANDYCDLKAAAERQRVSVAWIAREAVRTYLASNRSRAKKK
jgi:hypothetical protein